ncbi:cation:proton antiporter [Micromonospora tulbaghiae]|uniref:Cation:proton antiporter n=1 Tax=Micromonospora tulbaghiae TaxID=479978 RepID=A0AAW4JB49_9ACTN|nr:MULTISPECIES: cation:proton antiporter [Micromonospora]KAB1910344.1 cation/H(+) antiporter [Micromonospora sp. AMSO1212t]MBO4139102.1 cation:proton antiporter [Micromonospora tulbaghiae]
MAVPPIRMRPLGKARAAVIYLGMVVVPALLAYYFLRRADNPAGSGTADAKVDSGTLAQLLMAIVVVVVASKIAGRLVTRIGQPAVIGEIAAGIVLGPSVLGALWPDATGTLLPASVLPQIGILGQLGVVLFVFLAGLEIDAARLRGQESLAVVVSHVGIALPFMLGVGLALVAADQFRPAQVGIASYAIFVGVAMSVTALPVLARILQDTGLHGTRIGTLALTCALVDDVTAWFLLAMVLALVSAGTTAGVAMTVALTAAFTAVLLCGVRPLLRRARPVLDARPDLAVLVALVGLFASAWFTELIGVHAIFGAFLFGLICPAESRWSNRVRKAVVGLTMSLLLPLFFVSSGLRTEIGSLGLDASLWAWTGVVLLVAVVGKFVGTAVAARAVGTDWRTGLQIGTLMNCRGLTELIVLNIGLDIGVLTPELFTMLVLMALVSTAMAAPLLALLRRPGQEAPEPEPVAAGSG